MLEKYWFRSDKYTNLPAYVQAKIRIANCVALLLFMIMAGYAVFSLFAYPSLTWLPSAAFVLLLVAQMLIYFNGHLGYRIVLCILPTLVAAGYHGYLASDGAPPIPSIWLFQMAFLLLPLMLFDRRERAWQFILTLAGGAVILLFGSINTWLYLPLDDTMFREGPMHYLTSAFSLIMGVAAIAIMSETNYGEQMKVGRLLQKSQDQSKELRVRENEMKEQLKELENNRVEEERRSWASDGQALFGRIIRQHTGQELYDRLISEVVRYSDANQGALYVWDEDKNTLNLKAAYGYGRKKFITRSCEPGQGLLGQCYLEKDSMYMTDVPDGYTYITSGLGQATPTALLLVPLMHDGEVAGVLEMAAFSLFDEHKRDFLFKLGEDLAASLLGQQMQELTRTLLQEAQSQTEQMRAQEEEMRQNMEELAATQEEMQRKEQEYIRTIQDLEARLQPESVSLDT
ncbi:MAG: GAF domain-containing protein [Cyclobacteriaceae bacterium]